MEKYRIDYNNKKSFNASLLYGILIRNSDSIDLVVNGVPLDSYSINSPKQIIGNWGDEEANGLVFNADGIATMTIQVKLNGFAPQKPVESWRSGGSTHYSFTGGYKFTIQAKIFIKYKWKLSPDGYLTMQRVSTTTTTPIVTPDTSCRDCYTADGSDKLWARQVLADYKTNSDVREYQKQFNEQIIETKKIFEADIKAKSYRYDENTLYIDDVGLFQRVGKSSLIYYAMTNAINYSDALQELIQRGREELTARQEKKENVLRFMGELVRVSADKSIGFWGTSTILRVDFDNHASTYLKYIGLEECDCPETVKTLLGENVAKLLPIEDYRIKVDEYGNTTLYVIKKQKKNKKIALKTTIYFAKNNVISLSYSFTDIEELSSDEKGAIFTKESESNKLLPFQSTMQ